MSILVTGGSGFIGRHVVAALQGRGEQVIACGTRPRVSLPQGVQYARCDVLDPASVETLLRRCRPTHCIHLAWSLPPGDYLRSPLNWKWMLASLHLLELFARYGGRRFVGGGTCFEYAPVNEPRNEETTATVPTSLYGKAKSTLAQASAAAEEALGLECAWARIFYPIGPGDAPHRLLGGACRSVAEQVPFETRIRNQCYDLIDVRDIAALLVEVLFSEMRGVINLGVGHSVRMRDVLKNFFARQNCPHLLRFTADAAVAGGAEAEKSRASTDVLLADIGRLRSLCPDYPFISVERSLDDCLAWWSSLPEKEGKLS